MRLSVRTRPRPRLARAQAAQRLGADAALLHERAQHVHEHATQARLRLGPGRRHLARAHLTLHRRRDYRLCRHRQNIRRIKGVMMISECHARVDYPAVL